MQRQVVLDTETTGLEHTQGHRIIEIGCVELINRKLTGQHFHRYLNPHREIDEGAIEVHGITQEFLADKPDFATIADDFLQFIQDAELIIHNAPFDVGFISYEFSLLEKRYPPINEICSVTDTVRMARKKHPGQKNSLDALCKRYAVDNSQRDLHGALLDAEILADVYLAMTGGQTNLLLDADAEVMSTVEGLATKRRKQQTRKLKVMRATEDELLAHNEWLEKIKAQSGTCLWLDRDESD